MGRLLLRPLAMDDLDAIGDYIAQDSPERALAFLGLLEEKMRLLADNPRIGHRREELPEGLRIHPVKSYLIAYRPLPDGIEVIRVVHAARQIGVLFGPGD